MRDLYRILGVDKNSDEKNIKDAYRKRAKKLHPDTGGSAEKFGALKKAYDILSDKERRHKYDEFGEVDEKKPDNEHSAIINIIAFAFSSVLQDCANNGRSPLQVDIISSVRSKINHAITESEKQIRVLSGMLDFDKKMRGRFKSKKENIFESILENRISSYSLNIKNLNDIISGNRKSLDFIEHCSYEKDETPYESPGDRMIRMMGVTSYTA